MTTIPKRQSKKIKQNKEKKIPKKGKKKTTTEFDEGCHIWGGGIKKDDNSNLSFLT